MMSDPVFIVGTERSGSNLLRLLLTSHPSITIPHPPHVVRDLQPLLGLYGDLSDDKNFRKLAADVARLVQLHFAPWPLVPNPDELARNAPSRSLYGLYVALYERYREFENKPRWGCKSTFMVHHIGEILTHHGSPRIIHLVRDPRDVAVSAARSVFSCFHPYKVGQLWLRQQQEAERWNHLIGKGLMIRVRYEDLVSRPEDELTRLMSFLGESFIKEQLTFFAGHEAARLSSLSQSWHQLDRPISASAIGRYNRELRPEAIAYVEAAAASLMPVYGYTPVSNPGFPLRSTESIRIECAELRAKWRMEMKSFVSDKNAWLRLRKRLFLRALPLRRLMTGGAW